MIDQERSCYFCIHHHVCCIFNPILNLLAEHTLIINNEHGYAHCGFEDTPALREEVFDALASACACYQPKKKENNNHESSLPINNS